MALHKKIIRTLKISTWQFRKKKRKKKKAWEEKSQNKVRLGREQAGLGARISNDLVGRASEL